MKMQGTLPIPPGYLHYICKYNRFETRHKNTSVHLSPCFRDIQNLDIVTVGECRPLSKTGCHFKVLKVTTAAGCKQQFRKFQDKIPTQPSKQNTRFPIHQKKKKDWDVAQWLSASGFCPWYQNTKIFKKKERK
uniref:Uncharacterized protein n=1 Tax=Sciurus vulgaris TaxID=55149 RepID=A0A8D2DAY6_SCIVU